MTAVPACSDSRRGSGTSWHAWIEHAPRLVAESLGVVRDPLVAGIGVPPPAAPRAVAAALARALLPAEAADDPPLWLRADQRLSFARALAAARACDGALVADGVGTGKTYIGLAVAADLEPGKPIHVLAPATLASQWAAAAAKTRLAIRFHSHETLSRGRAPSRDPGAVIIDESHRFRTPATRRFATVAPWLAGRRGVLLTATPAVNRLEDVSHQLSLLVRPERAELDRLVITGEDRTARLPARRPIEVQPIEPASSPFERLRTGIGRLVLSSEAPVAGLLRVVFWHALASSPAAVADTLRRYHGLLLHARDAGNAGAQLSRAAIRRIVGAQADQLVLWPLVAEAAALPELALEDLGRVAGLEALARSWCLAQDAKASCLATLCADGRRALVFTTLTATVRHLRAHLGGRIAWCTGMGAGYGHQAVPREVVLDWFRTPAPAREASLARPSVLVATDVAAEGLDLPLLERVVHYDLPWTAVRLEQRSGRAIRLGTSAREVEVIRFRPPDSLECVLGREAIVETKSRLPERIGLGRSTDAPWRLRAQVAATWAGVRPQGGVAVATGAESGVVAAFRVHRTDGTTRDTVVARTGSEWTSDITAIAQLLNAARTEANSPAPDVSAVRRVLGSLRPFIRRALRHENGHLVSGPPHNPAERAVVRRLVRHARGAARQRRFEVVRAVEQRIAFVRRGHTAGERMLIERLAAAPMEKLLAAFPMQANTTAGAARAEVIGILFVEPAAQRD